MLLNEVTDLDSFVLIILSAFDLKGICTVHSLVENFGSSITNDLFELT